MSDQQPHADAVSDRSSSDRLETWGEIAAYLRREIRTVQRWEKSMGLPIRRLVGGPDKQSRVFALKHELDAWWRAHETLSNVADLSEEPSVSNTEFAIESPTHPAAEQHAEPYVVQPSRRLVQWGVALVIGTVLLVIFIPRIVDRAWPSQVILGVKTFRNLGDAAQEYIAVGLTEEMVTRLAQLHPARMSVVRLNDGAAASSSTKTRYILQGTVRRVNDEVVVTAQLMQSSNQAVVWGNSYERDVKDLLRLQTEVADTIASEVLNKFPHAAPSARQVNRDAYLSYLEGRYFWNQRTVASIQKALSLFHTSVNMDATYAPAYAGLADCYELLGSAPYTALRPRDAFPQAEAAARKALELDESLAEAHVSLGYAYLAYEWDFASANREFRRALDLRPSYATGHQFYGYLLTVQGELAQAVEERKKAIELDPLSPLMASALGEAYYQVREFDQTIAQNRRALDLDPQYAIALVNIGRAYEQKSMHAEAQAAFQKVLAAVPDDPAVLSLLGHEYAVSGRRSDALEVIRQLTSLSAKRYVPALYIALVYTGLGDKNEAFRWMDIAVEERAEYLIYLGAEPLADPLRDDPRFVDLTKRLGLKLR
jgi:TolB-like protein/Flp pilus assembly protein TadD